MRLLVQPIDEGSERDDGNGEAYSEPLRRRKVAAREARVLTLKERVLGWEMRERDPRRRERVDEDRHSPYSSIAAEVRRLPAQTQQELLSILKSVRIDASTELWGPEPELDRVVAAALWHDAAEAMRQQSATRQAISISEAAERAGLSQYEISKRVAMQSLSTVSAGAQIQIPEWQFDEAGHIIAGIPSLLKVFEGSAPALAEWVWREHPDLDQTPRAALISGRIDEVVFAASRGSGIA